ncbi:hypothetical protein SLE2022_185230 [Rubroshorea leprosula]
MKVWRRSLEAQSKIYYSGLRAHEKLVFQHCPTDSDRLRRTGTTDITSSSRSGPFRWDAGVYHGEAEGRKQTGSDDGGQRLADSDLDGHFLKTSCEDGLYLQVRFQNVA